MRNQLKSLVASLLMLSLLSMPCMAAQNYTYTTRIQDNYAPQPTQGTVVNNNYYDTYNTPQQVAMNYAPYYSNGYVPVNQQVPPNAYYNGYPHEYYNGYAGYNNAYVPSGYYPVTTNGSQPYNHDVTITQSYKDTRENVDKNISRAGTVATIIGGLALVGAVATAIVKN